MIKLPVDKVLILIDSLEGTFVELLKRPLLYIWRKHLPIFLSVCVMKDKEDTEDLYHIYLLDMIGCNVVGVPQSIHMEYNYLLGGAPILLSNSHKHKENDLVLSYRTNHKHSEYWSDFIIGRRIFNITKTFMERYEGFTNPSKSELEEMVLSMNSAFDLNKVLNALKMFDVLDKY